LFRVSSGHREQAPLGRPSIKINGVSVAKAGAKSKLGRGNHVLAHPAAYKICLFAARTIFSALGP
jgi:hypothetical protein